MNNKEKYEYFWEQVVPLLLKRLKHVSVCRSGSIFYGKFPDRVFCATPFWDRTDGIDCQWMTEDGAGLRGDTIPYDVTGDPELDYLNYCRAVENHLESLQLTPKAGVITEQKYFRTIVELVILSVGPFEALEYLNDQIPYGGYFCQGKINSEEEISAEQMEELLKAQGLNPKRLVKPIKCR